MSFVMAASAVVSAGLGVYKAVQGKKAAEAAKIEADKARVEMEKHKKAFAALDTSNPYLNMENKYEGMENTMEDLTVNQQQAEFTRQTDMQNQANIMGQMRGAAGSSGIAALAQSLANQGSLNAQKASASIGVQEAQNQKLAAAEASKIQGLQLGEDSRIQGLERQGDLMSRQMEFGKIDTLMGLSAGDVSNAQGMEMAGNRMRMSGIGDIAGGAAGFFGAMDGNWGGDKNLGTDIGKTAELPGGGTGGVTDLLGQLGGMSAGQGTHAQWQASGDSNFMTFNEWKQQGN